MPCAFFFDRQDWDDDTDEPVSVRSTCQFDESDESLIEFDGSSWCIFHLPFKSSQGTTSPKRTWSPDAISDFNRKIIDKVESAQSSGNEIDLTGVVFPGNIEFCPSNNTIFDFPDVLLSGAIFTNDVNFTHVHFLGESNFDKTQFFGEAEFGNSQFNKLAWFSEVTFYGRTYFANTNFKEGAYFASSHFMSSPFFLQATFGESVFFGEANFAEAQFDEGATFVRTKFSGHSIFDGARFFGNASFSDAIFAASLYMEKTIFGDKADFSSHGISSGIHGLSKSREPALGDFQEVMCEHTEFLGEADFTNRQFLSTTSFKSTKFAKAPKFHNCKLHADTDLSDTQFLDTESDSAARAYRTLKLGMEQNRSRNEQAIFYALEQKSLRERSDTPRAVKVVSWLYEQFANYGQSFMRPLLWLVSIYVVFFVIYSVSLNPSPASWQTFGDIARFTMAQVVRPFHAFTLTESQSFGTTSVNIPFGVAFVAAIHSIMSITFVAVILVALRRRFRMG